MANWNNRFGSDYLIISVFPSLHGLRNIVVQDNRLEIGQVIFKN
jgi:hypothetical protein